MIIIQSVIILNVSIVIVIKINKCGKKTQSLNVEKLQVYLRVWQLTGCVWEVKRLK